MSDRKLSPLIIGFIGALVVINVFGITKSFEALSLAREAQVSAATLSALQEQMERMRSELSDMTKKLAQGPAQFGRPAGPPPSFAGVHPGFPPASTAELALMNRPARANSPQQAGNTPAQPSGPQQKVAPQVLASHRKDLIERITNYHQEDAARYGDKITEYYDAARRNRGPSGSNMESDQAFSQLLSEYPDAHATGMMIAEKAIEAAGQANTVAVEQLYSLLQERQDYSSIVTDSGMEAVPAIQAYLAFQYIQQGRTAEAETLLQTLESKTSSGLIAMPGPKGDPEYRPVTEVVSGLRAQIPTQTQTQTQTKTQ